MSCKCKSWKENEYAPCPKCGPAFDYVVFIGKLQPVHSAHIKIIEHALKLSKNVICLLGSSFGPRTINLPWTLDERISMIRNCIRQEDYHRLILSGLRDYLYSNETWVEQVQDKVRTIIESRKRYNNSSEPLNIGIIGHEKDASSFYLEMFPQWNRIDVENISDIHACDIRKHLFDKDLVDKKDAFLNNLNAPVRQFINLWCDNESGVYDFLCNEYEFIKKYKKSWEIAPHPPTFNTVDAVILVCGHVLMIKRRAMPGKGLWALPGGFISHDETFEQAMLREVKEETKIDVPPAVLRGNIMAEKIFDAPNRSLRGRTITMGFYITLSANSLPKVKGSDDAEEAKWIPLNELKNKPEIIFEDHLSIIEYFTKA